MRNRNIIIKFLGASIIFLILISSLTVSGIKINSKQKNTEIKILSTSNNGAYNGNLKIYIVEPISRWNMYDNAPYHFALIDFACDTDISLNYLETYQNSFTWNGDATMDNVMVIAAVFNSESEIQYANPPDDNPYNSHHVDATAGATPGNSDTNTITNEYTHTVFIEEATNTGCQHCPDMGHKLQNIYESGDLPFYYVSLVGDKNDDARDRYTEDYNVYRIPKCFIDGGKKMIKGSGHSEAEYRTEIENCAKSDVHELELTLTVDSNGANSLSMYVSIKNNEQINRPSKPSKPSGERRIAKDKLYEYSTMSMDPNGDQLYYKWDWGDGTYSEWIGPFESGQKATVEHSWSIDEEYLVRVKARDTDGHESLWSDPKEIKLSQSFTFNNPFFDLLEYFILLIQNLFKK